MFLVLRVLRRATLHSAWLLPVLIIGFVFLSGWGLMAIAQPGTDIIQPGHYWWWFLITATTVGYGDLFPETTAGRLVGAYVVFGSIVTLAIIFSRISAIIENVKGRRMRGEVHYTGTGHFVVLGHTTGRTERLLAELLAEPEHQVVVAAWEDQAVEHPLPHEERVHFVRGDLTDAAVLERCGLARARAVLVDARDDNEAVTLTVAADHVAPEVHTVVALRDLRLRRTIARIDTTVHCVQWHATQMITEELNDPGIAQVYQELATAGGAGTYSTELPDTTATTTYGACQTALGRAHAATLLAVRDGGDLQVSAPWDSPVTAGARLYYVAARRLTPDEVQAALAAATTG